MELDKVLHTVLHAQRHHELHKLLDEAAADMASNAVPRRALGNISVRELLDWLDRQALGPDHTQVGYIDEEHKLRHGHLYLTMIDLSHTYRHVTGKMLTSTNLLQFMLWSSKQTSNPGEDHPNCLTALLAKLEVAVGPLPRHSSTCDTLLPSKTPEGQPKLG